MKLEPVESIQGRSPQLHSMVTECPASRALREAATESRQSASVTKQHKLKDVLEHISNFAGYEGINTNEHNLIISEI